VYFQLERGLAPRTVAELRLVRSMKPSFPILCVTLLFGCASESSNSSLVGTWRTKEANSYLRLYPGGRAAKWDDSPNTVTVWATYDQSTITFHDWDGNLIRRGSALVLQSEAGEEIYYRLPQDVEPPKRPNQTMQPTTGRRTASLHFMKTRSLQATLALASGG
jgi:hypothetical protein